LKLNMYKTSFVSTAMLATVGMAVNSRESMHQTTSALTFAQLEQSSRSHTCDTAMNRNKNTKDDFLSIVKGSKKFTDKNFPIDDALFWKDAGEEGRDMDQLDEWVTW